jgi:hypothetical protein
MTQSSQTESSVWSRPPLFMIGRDGRGNWVARDLKGTCGGLFVNREAAMRYVRAENAYRPQTVVVVSGVLELDMPHRPAMPPQELTANRQPLRRIA